MEEEEDSIPLDDSIAAVLLLVSTSDPLDDVVVATAELDCTAIILDDSTPLDD